MAGVSRVRAQDVALPDAPRAITLPDALAYARLHQPAIRASIARIAAQREQARIPNAQWLPTIGVTAQIFAATANNTTGTYVNTDVVDVPRIGATRAVSPADSTLKPSATTFVGAGITQEVFDFGRIAAQTAAADALVEVKQRDAETERLDIAFNVEEAFFAVDAAKAVLLASEGAYERARVHRELAFAGVKSGLRSPIELTRAEADLQRFDIGRIRARGGVAVGQSVLAAAIGAPEAALDTSGAPITVADIPALGVAMQEAARRDPMLRAALARLKAQEQQTRAVGAEMRPDISATGTISGRAGGAPPSSGTDRVEGNGFLPAVPNWDVGLVLSWPLFDGAIDARRRASHSLEEVRRDEIDVARQNLRANVEQAYVAVDVARSALPGLKRAADAALANYAQADARFKAGLGTSVELADAEALRADAEIQLAIGTFDLAKTRAALGRAIAEGL